MSSGSRIRGASRSLALDIVAIVEITVPVAASPMFASSRTSANGISPEAESRKKRAKIGTAIDIARTGSFDAAIIDINLDGSMTYPVADILKARAIPFAFTTGYGKNGIDNAYSKVPILPKPFSRDQLETLLNGLLPR